MTGVLMTAGCTPGTLIDTVIGGVDGGIKAAAEYPLFTDADEARMAQENARKFEAEHTMWDAPLLEAYLAGVTQRLVEASAPHVFPYRVRVVEDPAVNAFTFGGGLINVNAGLIARMENEAQLAFILAHEIAHVVEHHVPEGITAKHNIGLIGGLAGYAAGALLPG